ncbi:MAG: M23 family metallopeptidase [Bifidobacteriaceae bacterium]|nr:M23 family metallopeptidase [Bifidobacteriaceae bacterium]
MPRITHADALSSPIGYGVKAQDSIASCADLKHWPFIDADGAIQKTVVKEFSPPLKKWLPGHRGVDIALPRSGSVHVVAPARGEITFSGKVAGKSDLSMKTEEGVVFSFEPASSELTAGTEVKAGERIGTVEGESDHCNDSCVHWGARRNGVYVDPLLALSPLRIILKPL